MSENENEKATYVLHIHIHIHTRRKEGSDRPNQPVDFFCLSLWIIDDIHIQLYYAVNVVPVRHHSILIGAQPNHHPHWQLLQGTHRN
jgi:hypothetical protein